MYLLQIYIIGIFIVELVVIGLVGGLVIGLVHTTERRSRIIGILCIVFNLAMSGSPLTIAVYIRLSHNLHLYTYDQQ